MLNSAAPIISAHCSVKNKTDVPSNKQLGCKKGESKKCKLLNTDNPKRLYQNKA